jgi:transposase-like protein
MKPRFCPNSRCMFHYPESANKESSWFIHYGYHHTKVVGKVKRYRCLRCGSTFSDRTFDIDYYTKKTISYREVFFRMVSTESLSSISRNLKVRAPSVQNRIDRLSREMLALHHKLEKGFSLREDLVADGFESFDRSQYFPNNITILVGQTSQYLYGFTHTTIRRKGRMTESQKARRKELERKYRAPREGIERSFSKLLEIIPLLWNKLLISYLSLITDEHFAYPRAISHIDPLVQSLRDGTFRHTRVSSTLARTLSNLLFPVNYYDRELRKDLHAHTRESTCFCRNVANGLTRLSLYQGWHNFIKPFRVKHPGGELDPHGVYAGIEKWRIGGEMALAFKERSFLSLMDLRAERLLVWMKSARTPLKEGHDYLPKYAIA